MRSIEFRAMGSQMLALLDSDTAQAGERIAQIPALFESWERTLSRFRTDSELSKLNRASGSPFRASPVLWAVLHEALNAAHLTGGLVTPTMLAELERSGYDRTFEQVPPSTGRPATLADFANPVGGRQTGWADIKAERRTRTVTLPAGVRIDLGGIAKGWAADSASAWLGKLGPALVDAGGDISVSRPPHDGTAWPIGVADPIAPDRQIELLAIRSGGVATSGRDYRRWRQGETWKHHILDPRTGDPAETDVLSATVIGRSTREAEVAAKAALILGSHKGLEWIEARPTLAALLVLEDGSVVRSSRLPYYTWS